MSFSFQKRLEASEGQHLLDVPHVGLMHGNSTTQLALVLRGLLGQDVALERLAPFDGAPRTHAEPLGRALLGLHFGHDCSFLVAPAGARKLLRSCWPAEASCNTPATKPRH